MAEIGYCTIHNLPLVNGVCPKDAGGIPMNSDTRIDAQKPRQKPANSVGCMHWLVWFFENPYRYRCLKCHKKLKIQSGYLLSNVDTKNWFNENGGWPWTATGGDA